jgi:asparagine synthase (glutamine-hydrolysing)
MCGISAVYAQERERLPDVGVVRRMVERQSHRGPDQAAVVSGPGYHIGANRLRIVDPTPEADQPVSSDEGDVHLVFNGEVFNHRELREPLRRAGVRFRTGCDSETVLRSYLAWDTDALSRFEGQFALCLVDERRGRLVLARDPLGICPLYYVEHRDVVYVASSVEALLTGIRGISWSVDREAVAEYLLLRYTLAIVFEGRRKQILRHWHVRGIESGPAELEDELRHRLRVSVARNATSDVPIGAFLSGGVDSSIVVGLASDGGTSLDTLSIHLGEHSNDETAHALLAAETFGCRHHVYRAHEDECSTLARGCLGAMDHPTGARDAVATWAMARKLKDLHPSVKVVLTGTGADELFAGYSSAYFRAVGGSIEAQCERYVRDYACTSEGAWHALRDVVVDPLPVGDVASDLARRVRRLLPGLRETDPVNVLCAFYLVSHLPGWELPVQDTMCMASSLEPRVPFLARAVVDVAMAIAGDRKVQSGREKAVLRNAFAGLLPATIRARPKLPLSRLVARWLCEHAVQDLYRGTRFRDRGIFSLPRLSSPQVIGEFDVMWRLLALEQWVQRSLD